MVKAYYISPIGQTTPNLFSSFRTHFEATNTIYSSDVVLIDLHTRISDYNQAELNEVLFFKKPIATFSEWDYGGMAKDKYPEPLTNQQRIFFTESVVAKCKIIHFVRKMDKTQKYAINVFPYELTQYTDHKFKLVSSDELWDRPFDICWVGNKSPQRESVISHLCNDSELKVDFIFPEERLSHQDWLNRHKQAKLFLEADGGGFGSERPFQLIPISCMLRQSNTHFRLNDWENGIDCVDISCDPTNKEMSDLKYYCSASKEKLYQMYLAANIKLLSYFNPEYRAEYIHKTICNNLL